MFSYEEQPTILLIDSEPIQPQLLERLESQGLHTLVVQDEESGLRRAQVDQPNLIVLEALLSDGDGFALCRQLKADPATRAIPVIFHTFLTLPEDRVNAFAAGAVDYIIKPVSWEELLARIHVHLQTQRSIEPRRVYPD